MSFPILNLKQIIFVKKKLNNIVFCPMFLIFLKYVLEKDNWKPLTDENGVTH